MSPLNHKLRLSLELAILYLLNMAIILISRIPPIS